MTTPTAGEWMSAKEALEFLQLPQADAMKAYLRPRSSRTDQSAREIVDL